MVFVKYFLSYLCLFTISPVDQFYSSYNQRSFRYSSFIPIFSNLDISNTFNPKDFITHKPNLRVYGPIIIDFNNIIIKGQKRIIPAINQNGQPIFIAIHCSKSMINVYTNSSWKKWLEPRKLFEEKLISENCSF